MATVLLTTVFRPFSGVGEGDSVAAELFHAQVTRVQGVFSLRRVIRCWDCFALHFKHPAFTAAELEQLQKDLFRRDFETLGPSLVRLFKVWGGVICSIVTCIAVVLQSRLK